VLVEVFRGRRAPKLLPQLPKQSDQVGGLGEAPRNEPRLPFRLVPAAEVLDDGLRMHGRFRVVPELAHGRRAPQALGGGTQLLEDLLVGVALPDPGLELGERGRINASRGPCRPAFLGHSKKNRSG
jgi:hypothetical protein